MRSQAELGNEKMFTRFEMFVKLNPILDVLPPDPRVPLPPNPLIPNPLIPNP